MESDRQLKRWYNQFNRRYFAGELPADTILFYETVAGGYGDCNRIDESQFVIRITPAIAAWTEITKVALLHEMCHVRCWPYREHNGQFDKELRRLAGYKSYRKLL